MEDIHRRYDTGLGTVCPSCAFIIVDPWAVLILLRLTGDNTPSCERFVPECLGSLLCAKNVLRTSRESLNPTSCVTSFDDNQYW